MAFSPGFKSDGRSDSAAAQTQVMQQAGADKAGTIVIPKSIHDVDNGKILGFGADLAEDHPVSDKGLAAVCTFPLQSPANMTVAQLSNRRCPCLCLCACAVSASTT